MMPKLLKRTLSVAILALLSATPAVAITNLTIAVEGTNVVLSWLSTSGKTYLIQYRPSLDTNTPWVNLTNNFPAATGTNVTRCVIEGVVTPPPGGGGGGGGGAPPSPSFASGGESFFYPLFDMWQWEGRDPYVWEAEKRPPYPW